LDAKKLGDDREKHRDGDGRRRRAFADELKRKGDVILLVLGDRASQLSNEGTVRRFCWFSCRTLALI